jgi:hypothetical protein
MSTGPEARLHELFTERLSRIPAPLPRAPRRHSRPTRALAGAVLALLLTASLGLVLEVNASAESQGASCADAMTKIKLLVDKLVGESFASKTEAEQIATKVRLGGQTDAILQKYSCPKGTTGKEGAPEKRLPTDLEVKDPGTRPPADAAPQKTVTKP